MTPELELRLQKIEAMLAALIKSDRLTVHQTMAFNDGRNIQTAKNTGTIIATEGYTSASNAGQKLGFFGLSPKTQPTLSTGSGATNVYSTGYFADSSYGNNEIHMLNGIYQAMIGLGLIREIS